MVVDDGASSGPVRPVGWRPVLAAELVRCEAPAGRDDVRAHASDRALHERLRLSDLVGACEVATSSPDRTDLDRSWTVCRTAGTEAHALVAPTVILGASRCAASARRPFSLSDLSRLNEARAFETALLSIRQACPSRRDALGWATAQLERTGVGLEIIDAGVVGRPHGACFGITVDWGSGTATVEAKPAR
ncbi:MAG: hypothetical protein JWO77_78 [Ilumatobacteraceae bacterium]|nr:hypothetical protein [Ilumatobacteraceae bacterium]